MRSAIADTSGIVAFLDRSDLHHVWAVAVSADLRLPWLTCEAVLAESWHLLRGVRDAQGQLLGLAEDGLLSVGFSLAADLGAVRALLAKYHDVPMSLADACLVRMAEQHDDHAVFTLDADFAVYRKHGDLPIPLVTPSR